MEECEICGRKSEELYLVDISGTQLAVCKKCSAGKDILQTFGKAQETQKHMAQKEVDTEEIAEHYGRIIRQARESMGLPAKVLAERISERESTLLRVENEHGLPDDRLARKLEKALGIRLILKAGGGHQPFQQQKQGGVTLGDAAVIKKGRGEGE